MARNAGTKKKPDAKAINRIRVLRAIRRLARRAPTHSQEARLKTIEGLASGKIKPEETRQPMSKDLTERLQAGMASRSPHNALDKVTEPERKRRIEAAERKRKARKEKAERDREEKGGMNRSADLNT
jgi:hypothetical protein